MNGGVIVTETKDTLDSLSLNKLWDTIHRRGRSQISFRPLVRLLLFLLSCIIPYPVHNGYDGISAKQWLNSSGNLPRWYYTASFVQGLPSSQQNKKPLTFNGPLIRQGDSCVPNNPVQVVWRDAMKVLSRRRFAHLTECLPFADIAPNSFVIFLHSFHWFLGQQYWPRTVKDGSRAHEA